ncbi:MULTISPECIES: hypothetical protein [Protofrankia]|uniref:hypothetical protein n=1 Tax=Protofrankia TaxID=2994361 RepID=UPI0012F68E0B|nr:MULTISPECIES: hypothetical protein [Protofrankia]
MTRVASTAAAATATTTATADARSPDVPGRVRDGAREPATRGERIFVARRDLP